MRLTTRYSAGLIATFSLMSAFSAASANTPIDVNGGTYQVTAPAQLGPWNAVITGNLNPYEVTASDMRSTIFPEFGYGTGEPSMETRAYYVQDWYYSLTYAQINRDGLTALMAHTTPDFKLIYRASAIQGFDNDSIRDRFGGTSAEDVFDGRRGDDLIESGDGDDTLTGGLGDDWLDGGSGTDTAIFSGVYTDYEVAYDAVNDVYEVTNPSTLEMDTLEDIENVSFLGGGSDMTPAAWEAALAAPVFSIANASADENAGTMTFNVTRSGPATLTHVVSYETQNGTAVAGSDYTAVTSGTLSFAPADPDTKTINITITDDNDVEGDETFTVELTNVNNGATVSPTQGEATGTIVDDDSSANTPIDVNGGTYQVTAPAQLGPWNAVITGNLNPYETTASDMRSTIFPEFGYGASDSSMETRAYYIQDWYYSLTYAQINTEGLTALMARTTPDFKLIYRASAIQGFDNDSIRDRFGGTSAEDVFDGRRGDDLIESGEGDDTLTGGLGDDWLDGGSGTDTAVFSGVYTDYEVAYDAVNDVYEVTNPSTLEMDTLEDIENVSFLGGGSDMTPAAWEAALAAPVFSIANASADEDAGTMTFNVTRSGTATLTHVVSYETHNGTGAAGAVAGSDYTGVTGGTLSFAPADPDTKSFNISINGDSAVEGDETFTVELTSVTNDATVSDANGEATGTIVDGDSSPNLSQTVAYDYDPLGRVIKMTDDPTGKTICYIQDSLGNRQRVKGANGDCVNSPPVFVPDATVYVAALGSSGSIYPLSNDTDSDGDTLRAINIQASGIIVVYDDETKAFEVTALFGTGTFVVTYEISDGVGGTDSAVLNVVVTSS